MAYQRFKEISTVVDVSDSDKHRLKAFMKNELAYYNNLIEVLSPRTRTFPESIVGLHKDWENLWGDIAYHGFNLKTLNRAKEDAELPAEMEKHRKMLVGRDTKGRRFLDEKMISIMGAAGLNMLIHPMVRRNMANQILKFYKEQATKILKSKDEVKEDGDIYSEPLDLLAVQDITTKRHLQIPRQALLDVRYISEKDHTEIYTPYTESPFIVRNTDLESDNQWNMVIIHQVPGRDILPKDQWVIDVKHSTVPYLIKYVDQSAPRTGKIFSQMKKRSY